MRSRLSYKKIRDITNFVLLRVKYQPGIHLDTDVHAMCGFLLLFIEVLGLEAKWLASPGAATNMCLI